MMSSLYLKHSFSTPPTRLPWEEKRKEMFMSCLKKNSRNLTTPIELLSHVNEGASATTFMQSTAKKVHLLPDIGNLGVKEVTVNGKITESVRSKEMVSSDGVGIIRFLRGKVLLVTGATGFLAKVLIEKILKTVPDVGKIYLLIKAKDKDSAMERLKKEILNTELFHHVRVLHGKSHQAFMLSKLVPVVGNVCESRLGIEKGLADRIASEVDIIVNSAGNTTFDERYDVALDINTMGPSRTLDFAKGCRGLKLFLHVSTAYANGERQGVISEKPFSIGDSIARERASLSSSNGSFPPLNIDAELNMVLDAKNIHQDKMVTQKMKRMGLERARFYGWQDTYVFTKAMGEMMIESNRDEVPVVIIRPSIIESTYKEPIAGWIEGIRMLDPIILSYGKGELTGFPADANGIIDTVPADMVVNGMIAAMAKHGIVNKAGVNIYHIASSVVNPLSYRDLTNYFYEYFNSYPYMDLNRKPITIQKFKLFHSVPDFYSDIKAEAVKKSANSSHGVISPRRIQRSLDIATHLANIYQPYSFYAGRFDNRNTQKLMEDMSQEERRTFGFDVGCMDWQDYLCNIHIPGLLRHVQKGRGL